MISDEHSSTVTDAPRAMTDSPGAAPTSLEGGSDVSGLLAVDAGARATIRVLVVDDDRTLRESCAKFLEIEGYQVTVSRHGQEALDLLRQRAFHIVLLDLYMTGVPGMDLLRAALEKNPDSIVIVMTGNPSVQSSIDALRAGAWDYLPKPFSATHLQVLIGRAAHAVVVRRGACARPQSRRS